MFIIKSIRLKDFRAIHSANLKPLEKGITGIFGTNGAGKTTFLTAALFALFGERPDRTNAASLRRENSTYTEDCTVSMVVEHLGQTVEVIREIKGKANKAEVYIYVDGVEISTTSVGTAEKWIRQRFGINAEGFKTAFVIKQKELDSLVSARPAERKALIEKLAGIEAMNQALIDVRKDENNLKKTLEGMPGSSEAYEKAKKTYEALEIEFTKISEEFSEAKKSLKQAELNFDTVNTTYMSAREKTSYIEGLVVRVANKKNELVELNNRLKIARERLSGVTVTDVERIINELKTLDDDLVVKREEFNSLRVAATVAERNISQLNIKINTIESAPVVEPVSVSSESLEEQLSEAETLINEKKVAQARLHAEHEMLKTSLDVFSHDECPTCHRAWEDTEAEKNKTLSSVEKVVSQLSDLDTEIVALGGNDIAKTHKARIQQTRQQENAYRAYIENQNVLDALKKQLVAEQESLISDELLEEKKNTGIHLAKERDSKQTLLTEAKLALQFQADVDNLESKIVQLNVDIPKLNNELKLEQRNAPDLKNIEQELREARQALDEERGSFELLNNKLNAFNITYYEAKSNHATQEHQWSLKKSSQKRYQSLASQTDILERFRKDSVGRLAPELSSYATSFISEMTSGAFTEIILTEDFSPSVITSEGNERAVSMLSGGEESAVALALRLAISFLISKENPEFLWLDEVLTAQDADRRSSMLALIRRLPISQVIIINHSQEASDIVDKVITIIPDLVNGSTIEEL